MHRFLFLVFAASSLASAPRPVAAQDGGHAVQTTVRTQFVFKNGEVLRRDGKQLTPLTQNVKLANGTKINYKNGIVEMPADKLYPQGKKISLHEGDYVRPDGGVVFASPGSATASQGLPTPATGARYTTYAERGPGYSDPALQISLLNKKVELLTQKVALLSQGRPDKPDTKAIDDQLAKLEMQMPAPK